MPRVTKRDLIVGIWRYHDKHERWHALQQVADKMSINLLCKTFVDVWANSESNDQRLDIIEAIIQRYGLTGRTIMHYADAKDKKVFNALPERFVVHRGTTLENPYGDNSWTIDKKKALWFAQRCYDATPALASGVVNKEDVLFYTDQRGEAEIAVRSPAVVHKKTLTRVGEYQENEQYKFYALVQGGGMEQMFSLPMMAVRIGDLMRHGKTLDEAKDYLATPIREMERIGFPDTATKRQEEFDGLDWARITDTAEAYAKRMESEPLTFSL